MNPVTIFKLSEMCVAKRLDELWLVLKKTQLDMAEDQFSALYAHFTQPQFAVVSFYLLQYRLKKFAQVAMGSRELWLENATLLLINFAPQDLQGKTKLVGGVARAYAHCCTNYIPATAKRALWALLQVLEKMRYRELTPVHTAVCMLALFTKHLYSAVHVIEDPLYKIDRESSGVGPSDVILYYYYAGSIALATKQYSAASRLYELALAVPCEVAHSAAVEAYKKLVLVHLLVHGESYSAPRFISPSLSKAVKALAEPYSKLAKTFTEILKGTEAPGALHALLAEHSCTWKKDQNGGFVGQVKKVLLKHRIRRLTRTYVTLSYAHIEEMLSDPSTLKVLFSMIHSGELPAKVDEVAKVVSFQETEREIDIGSLEELCSMLLLQHHAVEECAESIALDPRYLKKAAILAGSTN